MKLRMKGRPSQGVKNEARAEGESPAHELREQESQKGDSDDMPRRRLKRRRR